MAARDKPVFTGLFCAVKVEYSATAYSAVIRCTVFYMADLSVSVGLPDNSNPHYLRAVSDMAGRRSVVAHDAIYNDNGIKLVDKGGRISTRLYNQLVQHRLREPLENQLTVENTVDVAEIMASARDLAKSDALAALLVRSLGSVEPMLEPLRSLPLPAPVAFKMTVMREERPVLFQHSVQMVLVALFLGVRTGVDTRSRVSLAAAALLHDTGSLHMDPAWLDPQVKITGTERKHLVAHPVTAMLMVRDAKVYSRSVELAVLEHHERMDGTGYPRALSGTEISPLGRILLLAEVVSAFYAKFAEHPARQLSLMLRLNHHKFPADLVAHVLALLQSAQAGDANPEVLSSDAERPLQLLAQALQRWEHARDSVSAQETSAAPRSDYAALVFVDKRVRALEKMLAEAGAHPAQQAAAGLGALQGDADGMAEAAFVGRESLWQLRSIANACLRRWPSLPVTPIPSPVPSVPSADAAVSQWCDWVLQET